MRQKGSSLSLPLKDIATRYAFVWGNWKTKKKTYRETALTTLASLFLLTYVFGDQSLVFLTCDLIFVGFSCNLFGVPFEFWIVVQFDRDNVDSKFGRHAVTY